MNTILPKTNRIQVLGDSSKSLHSILDPHCNLSIWKRDLSSSILSYVSDLLYHSTFKSLQIPGNHLDKIYNELPFSNDPGRLDFIEDVIMLYSIFKEAIKGKKSTIHITTITRMQCPLFHVDFNELRMLCTYSGNGTIWIDELNSDRSHLGCGHNEHIVRDLSKINEVSLGSVAILKGERYSGNIGYGIIHKSPEVISETKRLLLRIE